ncbi:hypothetical protein PM082_016156 [Marasmius tenuissimus]|nr:hypothetical protein PM082_016156 [Marasmius tenuissimus]
MGRKRKKEAKKTAVSLILDLVTPSSFVDFISRGACSRCKRLKVRCEFRTDTGPCKRCLNGGHECMIPGRKKRRIPPEHERLLAEIQKQGETIDKLMESQLAGAGESKRNVPNSSASDVVSGTSSSPILSPSSGSYFDEPPNGMSAEKSKIIEVGSSRHESR